MEDLARIGVSFSKERLAIPVFATDDGGDLRAEEDLTEQLLALICERPVRWLEVRAGHLGAAACDCTYAGHTLLDGCGLLDAHDSCDRFWTWKKWWCGKDN